ncbi:uncharacterized protein [Drosophila bipectinata]|uniref:uncharacterized protein n=1 Tax=Drosophila bipectinata TaxID=42026 RepID=UPI0038B31656
MQLKQFTVQIVAFFAVFGLAFAFPKERLTSAEEMERASAISDTDTISLRSSEALENLYVYERSLSRFRRALEELAYEEAADDMELAEINVFRPLFRYRSQRIKAKNPQPHFG